MDNISNHIPPNHIAAPHLDGNIIDHEQFEDMRDLLEEDFADLVQMYITDSEQRVEQLYKALQANDNANGYEIAHTLKGASANLGTTQLMTLSSQLQEACRMRLISEQEALIEALSIALKRATLEINKRLDS